MKVAVTGATGFIGRNVISALEERSISPVLICRPTTELPLALRKYAVVRMDIRDNAENSFELMREPDVLIHLAWGGLPHYKSLHHFEEELPAHYKFLKRLAASGLRHLLVTGTCFEYGMQCGPLSEDREAQPNNPYGFAKDMLHRQLRYLQKEMPFALVWARLFYLFGQGQAQGSLLPQLKEAVARGDRFFNMSGGEQIRDYMPVAEAARRLVALALSGRNHGAVNICSGEPTSVRNLVENWIRENNWSIGLNLGHYPYPDYEPMAFWGDAAKANRCLAALDE